MKLTPINNPVALRLDTSVGTRIFAGTTMIHGDTGIRTIASWTSDGVVTGDLPPDLMPDPGFSGFYRIGRRGGVVSIYLKRAQIVLVGDVMPLPNGFRPGSSTMAHTNPNMYRDGSPSRVRITPTGISFPDLGSVFGERIGVGSQPAKIQFDTVSSWPTTLPGLPA